ncbi:MAG: chorismate--pyruvate lyase [Pseudomonas sp.]|nr:chorismate--pyruvate lyase [Pseudomonas sp.]
MVHPRFMAIPSLLWQAQDQMTVVPDEWVADVLFDRGSLSRRLSALSQGVFGVMLLRQEHCLLQDDECLVLNLPSGSCGWTREVYLTGFGKPWVYARTVMSDSVLQQDELGIESLGNRPLGGLLFGADHFSRGTLEVCRYLKSNHPAHLIEPLWMRRSNFARGPLTLCVSEMFLPAFWAAARKETMLG